MTAYQCFKYEYRRQRSLKVQPLSAAMYALVYAIKPTPF